MRRKREDFQFADDQVKINFKQKINDKETEEIVLEGWNFKYLKKRQFWLLISNFILDLHN